MFDILNSHHPFACGFKQPLTRANIEYVENKLAAMVEYLKTLSLPNGTSLMISRRKTFLIGFITASKSFVALAHTLFDKYPEVKYLLGYKLSQDHIETLFSRIRSRGGFNNNPDATQFRTALRGLLAKTEVTASSNANCFDLSPKSNMVVITGRKQRNPNDDADPDIEEGMTELHDLKLPDTVVDIVEYIGKIFQQASVYL